MPIAATKHTPAGARTFAKFFIQTIDWGYATTSASYMRHYYEKSCVACRSAADAIDKAARAHHRFIGDRFQIRRTVHAKPRGSQLSAVVYFDVTSVEVVDAHDKYVNAQPALINFQEHIYVAWRPGGWRVVDMIPKA